MDQLELLSELCTPNKSKIILFVMDGLGGLPETVGGKTELETAYTPNLNNLATQSVCGLLEPILPGITPGSGPAHLALFGYDPLKYIVGRGVLSALGVGISLQQSDIAARINFAAMDDQGLITDRRAGRIATEKNQELTALLEKEIKLPGIQLIMRTEKEHRAAAVFRGTGLHDGLTDTDPQITGVAAKPVTAINPQAENTAGILNEFVAQANRLLAGHHPANTLLMRGIDSYRPLPAMGELYQMRTAAIAGYPMYRGVAQLAGMTVLETENGIAAQLQTLEKYYNDYDFFFFHVKKTDSTGEDGNFAGKVTAIEEVDKLLPRLLALKPDVVAITGDHSTPAVLKSHGWHPVPVLLYSKHCRPDDVTTFGERSCIQGGLGHFPSSGLMPLLLANAMRLQKFGA